MEQNICPSCHFALLESYYFCPNCGRKIKEPPPSTSWTKQLKIYAISFFLPPFGLIPGIKYILQKDDKAKIIGGVAVALTILSTIFTIWFSAKFLTEFNNSINTQLQQYQNLGL